MKITNVEEAMKMLESRHMFPRIELAQADGFIQCWNHMKPVIEAAKNIQSCIKDSIDQDDGTTKICVLNICAEHWDELDQALALVEKIKGES